MCGGLGKGGCFCDADFEVMRLLPVFVETKGKNILNLLKNQLLPAVQNMSGRSAAW